MTAVDLPDWFLSSIAALLPRASAHDLKCTAISGGGNNRVFCVSAGSPQKNYVVKWYYTAPDDPRDRLLAEWSFAKFAWQHGLRCIPEPIACDQARRVAVFEFIDGRRLRSSEVGNDQLRAAIEFLLELNRHRTTSEAAALPIASEACFSIGTHIECVEERVQRLESAAQNGSLPADAKQLVQEELRPTTNRVVAAIRQQLEAKGVSSTNEISSDERILSPSDFGFHNALVDQDGRLRFFDFEYAGWDDPAKTICDYFSQVAVPIPADHWSDFISGISPIAGESAAWRATLLRPLYLVKWSCIVLNPLLKAGRDRREFSGGQATQLSESDYLEHARRILATLK